MVVVCVVLRCVAMCALCVGFGRAALCVSMCLLICMLLCVCFVRALARVRVRVRGCALMVLCAVDGVCVIQYIDLVCV